MYYDVNTHIGVCTCPQGVDGSACSHQAAIVLQFGDESCNYIATSSASARMEIAKLAIGNEAIEDPAFYASIHQKDLQAKYGKDRADSTTEELSCADAGDEPNFEGSAWNLIRAGARDSDDSEYEENEHLELCRKIDTMSEKLKKILASHDNPQLASGVHKFLNRFDKLAAPRSYAKLATSFHRFGLDTLGMSSSLQTGQLRYGKRIGVQATAAGRRRKGISRGKARSTSGRPKASSGSSFQPRSQPVRDLSRFCMPMRNRPKGKRLHSLSENIDLSQQNAGKW